MNSNFMIEMNSNFMIELRLLKAINKGVQYPIEIKNYCIRYDRNELKNPTSLQNAFSTKIVFSML